MADKKITQLTNITGANLVDADEFVVVDISADETKSITLSELKTAFDSASGFVRITGDTMTGNLSFGDNDKAIFGAGSDLQIYHDGNSKIADVGGGKLELHSDGTGVFIQKGATEYMAQFLTDGAVSLYHDNAAKLATTSTGVDITGTLTSDGLTSSAVITAQEGRSNTAGTGQIVIDPDDTTVSAAFRLDQTDNKLNIDMTNGGTWQKKLSVYTGGDISFYEDTGTTAKFVWKSADERLGIGTSSPSATLQVEGTTNGLQSVFGLDSSGLKISTFQKTGNDAGVILDAQESSNGTLTFASTGTERMRIDSSGNVGIGVISMVNPLHVGVTPNTASKTSGSAFDGGALRLDGSFGSADAEVGILAGQNDGLSSGIGFSRQSSSDWGTQIKFYTHSPAITTTDELTERMRIDSSGNLLVGKTSSNGTTVGGEIRATGLGLFTASGTNSLQVRRLLNDGDSVEFYKDTGKVGSISVSGSSTAYNTSSDYRLKTDAQPMTGASDRVLALNPVNFKWIADGTRVDGFLAHEAQAVVPEAVTGTKDAMMDEEYQVSAATGDIYTAGSEAGFNELSAAIEASPAYYDVDGNIIKAEVIAKAAVHEAYDAVEEVIHSADVEQPETLEDGKQWRETTPAVMGTRSVPDIQGIDQSKLVPLLVASLQEALARITALENA